MISSQAEPRNFRPLVLRAEGVLHRGESSEQGLPLGDAPLCSGSPLGMESATFMRDQRGGGAGEDPRLTRA
jgi:hypothetical protein